MEFYEVLARRRLVCRDDMLHAALLAEPGVNAPSYSRRVAIAAQQGWIDAGDWRGRPREVVTLEDAARIMDSALLGHRPDGSSLSRVKGAGLVPRTSVAQAPLTGAQAIAVARAIDAGSSTGVARATPAPPAAPPPPPPPPPAPEPVADPVPVAADPTPVERAAPVEVARDPDPTPLVDLPDTAPAPEPVAIVSADPAPPPAPDLTPPPPPPPPPPPAPEPIRMDEAPEVVRPAQPEPISPPEPAVEESFEMFDAGPVESGARDAPPAMPDAAEETVVVAAARAPGARPEPLLDVPLADPDAAAVSRPVYPPAVSAPASGANERGGPRGYWVIGRPLSKSAGGRTQ